MALLGLVMACQGLRCRYMTRVSLISVVVLTELLRMLPIRSHLHHLLVHLFLWAFWLKMKMIERGRAMFASTLGRSILSWRFMSLIIALHIVVLHTRLLASSIVELSPLLGQWILFVLVGLSPHVLAASITASNLWVLTTLSSLLLADSRISIASRLEVID